MAWPETDELLKYYFGADGNPVNDTDPVGGAIDTGSAIDELNGNLLFVRPVIGGTEKILRAVAYRKNETGGNLNGARATNRAGGNLPGSSGVFTVVSSSASDVGKVWLAFKNAGNWVPGGQEIQLAGVTPVNGLVTCDTNSHWIAIYESGVPVGDISILVNGVKVGQIFGGSKGNFCAHTLAELALATAQDATISATNRLTDPASGIGSFSRATQWVGLDNSLALPGTDLDDGHYIGYCVRLTVPAGMTKPWGGQLAVDIDLVGDPEA